jgi:hypothetical protein
VIAKGGHPVGKTGGPDGLALPGEHLPKTLVVANALARPPSGVGRALYGQPQSAHARTRFAGERIGELRCIQGQQ